MRDLINSLKAEVFRDHCRLKTVVILTDPLTKETYAFTYNLLNINPVRAIWKAYRDLASQWGTVL